MTAFYNEIDPYAAQWLWNLIAAGHIAPGVVDERSIEDIEPAELDGYTQCHFFAGIGVWSLALRNAGWPDDRPVWTGSCPCQPFSSAGKAAGFDDERHLWPAFHHLIEQCRPPVVIGEQVASKDAESWLDLVQADLEALGYAFGAVPFPSASVGAPHIRDRLYWVADNDNGKRSQLPDRRGQGHESGFTDSSASGGMGYPMRVGRQGPFDFPGTQQPEQSESRPEPVSCGLADTQHDGCDRPRGSSPVADSDETNKWIPDGNSAIGGVDDTKSLGPRLCDPANIGQADAQIYLSPNASGGELDGSQGQRATPKNATGPTNGFWGAADWLLCRDGKWRPVEPGTFPLAHGATSRVGRLRAYGNAINAEAARIFIECYMNEVV